MTGRLPAIRSTAGLAVPLLTRHRSLIWELAKREHSDRYAGSILGSVWAVGHPLALMAIYVVVFSFVFRVRIPPGASALPLDYPAYLMAGYLPWIALQECLLKSTISVASNPSLVKQVVFPVDVLPVKGGIAALLTQLVGTAFLVAYLIARHGVIAWTYLLFPVLLVLQLMTMVGVGLMLAAAGVFVRDLREFVQVGTIAGAFLLPIFYLPEWVPEVLRPLLYLNPGSYIVWCYQDVFYFGFIAHPLAWLVFPLGAMLALYMGLRFFHHVRHSFASAL
jgi:homopolymeric O-antigen transport system permease protein